MSKEKIKIKFNKDLQEKLKECEKMRAEYLVGWQRARADFLNYKKEETKKMDEFLKYANLGIILKILSILDNFYLAEKKMPESFKEDKNIKGLFQIKNQILNFLKNQGVEEIKSLGQKFDPNLHEAVEIIKGGDKETDKIIKEIQKGYKLYDKVIRPAKVRVVK